MIELALITAIGIYFIFIRLGIKKVLHFGASVDILVSIGLVLLLAGTFSGFVLGAIAGALVSIFLFVTKLFVKPEPPKTLTKVKRSLRKR